ncbi:N-acetylneuraminate synthase family protein [Ekhidna sp.]|uniref:N-acetylneuraminate synthase family protein n=1 Tax=Ekhidna sp. TaxID=2608089 RepID=UPI0032978421
MKIGNKEIQNFGSPYVIAEIGANHNGDMELAKKMIDSAMECGVDAVKFQSWNPTSLIAKEEYERNQSYDDSPKKHFGSLKEMVDKYYLREEQHFELKEYCDSKNVDFCSTPFSENEVDLLEKCDVPFYKVASMDINNFQLLNYLCDKNKPVILSTGMARLSEIDKAVELLVKNGVRDIALLHCISIYPPAYEDINLKNISMLQQAFDLPIGFSDHSIGFSIPLASVALGACIIEKHFTTDKNLPGWDHEVSADPSEMKIICEESANIAESMGSYARVVSMAEQEKKKKFRRSIVTKRELKPGHILTNDDMTSKRPGTGISPDMIPDLIGMKITKNIEEDHLISWDHLT